MKNRQRNGLALAYAENGSLFAFDYNIGSPEVLECCHDGDAGCVDQTTVMINDVYVCAESEAFQACDDAERLGIEGVRATNGFFEYAREDDFCVGRAKLKLERPQHEKPCNGHTGRPQTPVRPWERTL